VRGDIVLTRRVRHARISLDRATLLRRLPGIDRTVVAARYKRSAYDAVDERSDERSREALKAAVDAEVARYLLD
jgi:hypothetical protein